MIDNFDEGLDGDGFHCTNADECRNSRMCKPGIECIWTELDSNTTDSNLNYGFDCGCPKGHNFTNSEKSSCQDIDECEQANKCGTYTGAVCENFEGGFLCQVG